MSGYRQRIREELKSPGLTDFAIERSILRQWRREWSVSGSPYDTSWTDHFLAYAGLVMPKIDHHEFFVRQCEAFEETFFRLGRQIINFIGSQNSGKSEFFAVFSNLMVTVDPEYTRGFVAAPYMKAAHSTVWSSCKSRFFDLQNGDFDHVWPTASDIDDMIRIEQSHPKAGYLELVTVDKIGKLQGTKSRDVERGLFILIADEIALFPSKALLDILDNLQGNMNFICFTGCNFRDIEGLEGMLCDPQGREYSDLDADVDQEWDSAYESRTYRFDGLRNPNMLAGRNVFKYLMKIEDEARLRSTHGAKGPKYLEQVRSFPNMSMADHYVTTREKINSGGGFDDFVYDRGTQEVVAFCDPGFGGDDCKIGRFGVSNARISGADGQWFTTQIFEPLGPIEKIPIEIGLRVDDELLDRFNAAVAYGRRQDAQSARQREQSLLGMDIGKTLTPEQQVALGAAEFLIKHQIPAHRFGFDGSMRASIVQEIVSVLGNTVQAFDYNGKPTDRPADATGKKTAQEKFYNYATELYFAFASMVQNSQFRGAKQVPTAIIQICRRKWEWSGKKQKIQPKTEYKKENQGRSPDDADVLVGGLEMARRSAGLVILGQRLGNQTGGITQLRNLIKKSPKFRPAKAKRLNRV